MVDPDKIYPQSAQANMNIPEEKFYQASGATQRIKRLFIDENDKVVLKVVIAPRTMNISADGYDGCTS